MTSLATSQKAQAKELALFISDLHLEPTRPETTAFFLQFLQQQAPGAERLYILGDLFEYWLGDDMLAQPYCTQIAAAIRSVSGAGCRTFWMPGNRDFLTRSDFLAATGMTLLPDPEVVTLAGQRIILTHGDAQCADDLAYMKFRAMVRQPQWQQQFLSLPLQQRLQMVGGAREQSKAAQQQVAMEILDVNTQAIELLFEAHDVSLMIHGHTHRPARHIETRASGAQRVRFVLPDCECDREQRRGGWISVSHSGAVRRHDLTGQVMDEWAL